MTPLNDYDSLDMCERVLDAGRATAQELAELQRRISAAAELAEAQDDAGWLDDPAAELEAVRRGAAVAAGLKVGVLKRCATLAPDEVQALRAALKVHVGHLRDVRAWNSRRRTSA